VEDIHIQKLTDSHNGSSEVVLGTEGNNQVFTDVYYSIQRHYMNDGKINDGVLDGSSGEICVGHYSSSDQNRLWILRKTNIQGQIQIVSQHDVQQVFSASGQKTVNMKAYSHNDTKNSIWTLKKSSFEGYYAISFPDGNSVITGWGNDKVTRAKYDSSNPHQVWTFIPHSFVQDSIKNWKSEVKYFSETSIAIKHC
jgi:hypothetical protein